MTESYERLVENAADILDALDNTASSLENVLLHLGHLMTPSDQVARQNVVDRARELLRIVDAGS